MNSTRPQKNIAAWRKALTLLLAGLMALPQGALLAQTVPAGTTNTTVNPNGSGNGVPVVNIAAPNAAGLSHNKFNSYNVPVQGQILNNATAATVQTQLGGTILGNPNLAGKSAANVILNEVVQPNRSMLQGYQEVAGQAAQVIVANPYGITCTGCGFINTPRATLTTGTPNIDGTGNLTGFAVRQGDILINGGGLDASRQNFFDIVARSVVIQGQVNALDLLVAAGSNDFDYASRAVAAAAPSGPAPAYAIDSSALGGMYVDRIRLIATEAGVGVRMLGNVGASVDDIALSAAGRIQLQNQMSAARDISVTYAGAAQAGAVDVSGGAQVYAGRDQTIAAGAGGVALGNALVGAGGNLAVTGSSLTDSGGAANYRFADGALSASVAGAAATGAASYDAGGTLTISAGTVNLGSASLYGRSPTGGIGITASGGSLDVGAAQVVSPGNIALAASGQLTTGSGSYVASDANVTASFGGASFINLGTIAATGNLHATNTSGAFIRNFGGLSAQGGLTAGAAGLTQFTNEDGASLMAGALTINAPNVINSGYLQADGATFSTGADLHVGATGVMVLGTKPEHANSLALNYLGNQGTIYSKGNLTLETAQTWNAGQVIADGALAMSANRTPTGGLVNGFSNPGGITAGDLTISAPSISLTGGTVYASNDATLTTPGSLTPGGSLYAVNDLTLDAATVDDTVAGGSRGAGRNFSITTTSNLSLYSGQIYDAGKKLNITAPNVSIATGAGATDTTLSAGGTFNDGIFVNADTLTLGGADAAGSLESASGITLAPRASTLSVVVNAAPGHRSSILAGHSLSSRADNFTVYGDVLTNGGITLRPVTNGGTSSLTVHSGGWMEAAGKLDLKSSDTGRDFDATIAAGGTLAGNELALFLGKLNIYGIAGNVGLLQGGTAGGSIDVMALNQTGEYSHIKANRGTSASTGIHIGGDTSTSPFNNLGLIYAEGNLLLSNNGSIVNTSSGTIASGFGDLSVDVGATRSIDNAGYIYAGRDLTLRTWFDGTLTNRYGATIGAGRDATLGRFWDPTHDTVAALTNPVISLQNTVDNLGRIEIGRDATINATFFRNNIPVSVVYNTTRWDETRAVTGDTGRYGPDGGSLGWDLLAAAAAAEAAGCDFPTNPCKGTGAHDATRIWAGDSYYMINGNSSRLFRDFRVDWKERETFSDANDPTPVSAPSIAVQGALTIRTHTGENKGGDIYGGSIAIRKLNSNMTGTSFKNEAVETKEYSYRLFGREVYDCGIGGASCVLSSAPTFLSDVYASFWPTTSFCPAGLSTCDPGPAWTANDNVAIPLDTGTTIGTSRPATLRAPAGNFVSDIDNLSNVQETKTIKPAARTEALEGQKPAAPAAQTALQVLQNGPAPVGINAANLALPTGPNGQFVLSTNPASGYLVEGNPLFLSAYNPFLGSDYLAKLLELNPAEQYLRLGDANYEARLIQDQIRAQTGASILRTAYDAYEQQQLLMDNAVLEAKELKLNYGTSLTTEQVKHLKHDIVWMVEQEVQGKKVLVPVVYLSSATRAGVSGASIVANNVIVTGDSFLNRGGEVTASNQLVVVTRKDIVNSSGQISGGQVQMQSLEGDIINRTETFRQGDGANYVTTAGRTGGIYASGDLFLKAGRDVNVQGAEVVAGGRATAVAGRNVNVSALVLDARTTNFSDKSDTFNRDITRSVETTQTAQNATFSGAEGTALIGQRDVNVTGAYVGSKDGTTSLISQRGDVNVNTLQLTNTRTESTERVGFFAEGRVGAQVGGQDAAATQAQLSGQVGTGRAGSQGTVDSQVNRGSQKPPADPNATSVEGFAGLAIQRGSSSSSATGNMGSLVEGSGVNIVAKSGDVNITGSQVNSGADGTLIDAARNVNIMAAYDTASSTRKEETTRIGVAGEAGPGGAFAGVKVDGNTLDSQTSSRTAQVSSLGSQGSVRIRAGGTLTNEGTAIDAKQNVVVKATEVDNRAAQNTTTSNVRSSNFNVDLMGGVTTGGMGESIAGLAQGTGQELNIAAPEAQARLRASGGSSNTISSSSTAVVTQIKSGGSTSFEVKGAMRDEGTSYEAGRNINLNVGSYENRQATNTTSTTTESTSGGGTLTVGVDASRSANANVGVQGRNEQSSTSTGTAVVGGLKAGGNVNITSRGDVTLQGTNVTATQGVNIDAKGDLNLLQANNTSRTDSRTSEGSANLSASLCVDLSCASGGGGASARTTTLNENSTTGVAGSISGANVNLRSGRDMTLQGTNITGTSGVSLDAGRNIDFQALTSTISSTSTADGGGANLSLNVGASGKLATDGGGGGGVNFERGRGTTEGTVRQGGSVTSGGTFSVTSGGNTRLEGTQVQAGSANLNVGGNFTMESAQSTLKQDNSNVAGGVQLSAGKSGDGGRNFGGAVSLDVTSQTKDNLTNQNAGIRTSGTTTLNVGGNATMAGANIDAGAGVQGRIEGNLTVVTRADREKTEDSSFRGYVGVGEIQTSGKSDGSKPSTANRVDSATEKFGNVANTAGGTGVFINLQSDKKDNVTVGQQSGISGGSGGLGGLSVGGNATLIGAANTQGIKVEGTTTTMSGPQTRTQESSTDFRLSGTVASMAGSDQGSGGTFSAPFQASGSGRKPNTTPDAPTPTTRPRSNAVSGDAARPTGLGGATPPSVPVTRPRSNAVSGDDARPRIVAPAPAPITRPRANAVSGEDARPRNLPTPGEAPAPRQVFERVEISPAPALAVKVDAPPRVLILERSADVLSGGNPPPVNAPVRTAPVVVGTPNIPSATPSVPSTPVTPAPTAPSAPRVLARADARGALSGPQPSQATQAPAPAAAVRTEPGLSEGLGGLSTQKPGLGDASGLGITGAGVLHRAEPATGVGLASAARSLGASAAGITAKPANSPGVAKPQFDNSGRVARVEGTPGQFNRDGPVVEGFQVTRLTPGSQDGSTKLGAAERRSMEVVVDGGKLVFKNNPAKPVDTAGDRALFVVDSQGRMYLRDANNGDPNFSHASLADGWPVRIAGEIQVSDGQIGLLNNRSEVYGSNRDQALAAMQDIQARGLTIGSAGVYEPVRIQDRDGGSRVVLAGVDVHTGASFTDRVHDRGFRSTEQVAADRIAGAMKNFGERAVGGGRERLQNPANKLLLSTPGAEYRNENTARGEKYQKVVYLSGAERDRREVVVRDGILVNKITGRPFHTPSETHEGAIFVIDSQGRMYASMEDEPGKFHHTSFTGGEPVASAGRVVVKDGKLLHMNNFSGHYFPDVTMLRQGIGLLTDRGLDVSETTIAQYNGDRVKIEKTDASGKYLGDYDTFDTGAIIRPDLDRAPAAPAVAGPAWTDRIAVKAIAPPAAAEGAKRDANGYVTGFEGAPPRVNAGGKDVDGFRVAEPGGVGERSHARVSQVERQQMELVPNADGELVYKADPGRRFDTGNGIALFVIDGDGKIFASNPTGDPDFTHVSLANGGPVRLAGELQVVNGKVSVLDGKSSDYAIDPADGLKALQVVMKSFDTDGNPGEGGIDLRTAQAALWQRLFVDNPDGTKREVHAGVEFDGSAYRGKVEDWGVRAPSRVSADRVVASMKYRNATSVAEHDGEPPANRYILQNPTNGLLLTTAADKYRGEENGTVKFFTGAERDKNELVVRDGLLVNKVTGKPYSTVDRDEGAIFVIDSQGRMYASTEHKRNEIHHTSLTGGEPVASAGHVVVRDGRLLHMNNFSGHYRPSEELFLGGVQHLMGQGLNFEKTNVIEFDFNRRLAKFDVVTGKFTAIPQTAGMQFDDFTREDSAAARRMNQAGERVVPTPAAPTTPPQGQAPAPVAPDKTSANDAAWRRAA